MNTRYTKKFLKDLKALQSTDIYEKICALVLEEIPSMEDLNTIANLSKLKGDDTAYRIRVGDYRIGFFWEDDKIVMSFIPTIPESEKIKQTLARAHRNCQ